MINKFKIHFNIDYRIDNSFFIVYQIVTTSLDKKFDLKDNQKRMINSITNQEMKSIVIDRLVVDNDNDLSLITDPTSIKHLVNEHFQKCPGVINRDKSIPDEWIHQYTPKEHIDENIYKDRK